MIFPNILNLFLYFPEDKREYIPAAISFSIFLIAAFVTMWVIIKISKRQEEEAKKLEEQLKRKNVIRDEKQNV
jgi:preprotein translocase subunit YajC